jgi:hypothetical protein
MVPMPRMPIRGLSAMPWLLPLWSLKSGHHCLSNDGNIPSHSLGQRANDYFSRSASRCASQLCAVPSRRCPQGLPKTFRALNVR